MMILMMIILCPNYDHNEQVSRIGVEREKTDMKIEEEEELFKNLKSKVTNVTNKTKVAKVTTVIKK